MIIQLAMLSGKIGFGAEVMMSMVNASTIFTSETGANQLDVSASSEEARSYENITSSAVNSAPLWNVTP